MAPSGLYEGLLILFRVGDLQGTRMRNLRECKCCIYIPSNFSLSFCLSACLSVCLSVYLCLCLSVCLSLSLSVYMSISLSLSLSLSVGCETLVKGDMPPDPMPSLTSKRLIKRASQAGGYNWFVRGVIKFIPGGGLTRD